MAVTENAVVIVAGARTPVGSFNGSLSALPASQLGTSRSKRQWHGRKSSRRKSRK